MPREALVTALRWIALGSSVLAIVVLAGCGGDDDESPESTAAGAGTEQPGSEQSDAGAGSVETFGEEADPGDRDAAATTVERFLRAQADGDSATACSLMSASTKENLEVFVEGAASESLNTPCTKLDEVLRSQIPAKTLAQSERIQVTAVRVEGDRGFVLYRDARGTESAFSVVREGSAWKVAAIAGQSLP
jgi:hypothetical protein